MALVATIEIDRSKHSTGIGPMLEPTAFHLAEHGDSRQRQWAGRILPAWPHYEHFWRHYVVPLT
ncbi:MAG TPA: hypothetical protein VKA06_00880, partial [Spirochaetia bacterium]|nr:hypothetical protein [Spirochaetia bacterium]